MKTKEHVSERLWRAMLAIIAWSIVIAYLSIMMTATRIIRDKDKNHVHHADTVRMSHTPATAICE